MKTESYFINKIGFRYKRSIIFFSAWFWAIYQNKPHN